MQTSELIHTAAAGQPAPTPRHRVINLQDLQLALVARRVRPVTRWAAISDHALTAPCRQRQSGGGYLIHSRPLMMPMDRGNLGAVLRRVRSQGRAEVLRTWRASIAVMKAEAGSHVMRDARGGR